MTLREIGELRMSFAMLIKYTSQTLLDLKSVFPSSHVKVEYEDCDIFVTS